MFPRKPWGNSCKSNITWCLQRRQQCRLSYEEQRTILHYGVCQTTQTRRAVCCKFGGSTRSTYFLAFSPDGKAVASSHGDHVVRISEVKSGRCLRTLKGHPRSVWCLVFHPSNPYLLASGCLKGVVNVWDLTQEDSELIGSLSCQNVTSLAFHPTDMVLLIATGNQLLFWSWHQQEPFAMVESASSDEKIRLVRFDSLGNHILTGILDVEQSNEVLIDEVGSQSCENLLVNRTVVHVDMQNMATTVDHVTEEMTTGRNITRMTTSESQSTCRFRLQWWDFTHLEIPNLGQRNMHVVARNCLLSNNTSADISSDGQRLSALVVKSEGYKMVCVFSLEKYNFGQCLYSSTIGHNFVFSTCFSPLGTHIIVGTTCDSRLALFQDHSVDRTVAYIFKLSNFSNTNFLAEVATLKVRLPAEGRFSDLQANAVVWHPVIGYGLIAFGTNKGGVYLCHV